jgi:hypothetical protein
MEVVMQPSFSLLNGYALIMCDMYGALLGLEIANLH